MRGKVVISMAMKGGNPQNLVVPTSEQARINGAKGGRASQAAQRKKKTLQEIARALLESEGGLTDEQRKRMESLGIPVTQGSALVLAMQDKAHRGSERAAEFVRDTSGQAPKQVQQIVVGEGMTPDEIRGLSDEELQKILSLEAEE